MLVCFRVRSCIHVYAKFPGCTNEEVRKQGTPTHCVSLFVVCPTIYLTLKELNCVYGRMCVFVKKMSALFFCFFYLFCFFNCFFVFFGSSGDTSTTTTTIHRYSLVLLPCSVDRLYLFIASFEPFCLHNLPQSVISLKCQLHIGFLGTLAVPTKLTLQR